MPTSALQQTDRILPVHSARNFVASDGANLGDPLGLAENLIAGDVYKLSIGDQRACLALTSCENGTFLIAPPTEAVRVGAAVTLDACVTFMSADGAVLDALLLVEHASAEMSVSNIHVYPLAKMSPRIDYAIVAIDRNSARTRFDEADRVTFAHGTHIDPVNGTQRPVESLRLAIAS